MLNLDMLSYWTLPKYPCLITPISTCGLTRLNKGQRFSQHFMGPTLCYVVSGSVDGSLLYDQDDKEDEEFHATERGLFYWSSGGILALCGTSEDCTVMLINFAMYTLAAEDGQPCKRLENHATQKLKSLYIEMPTRLQLDISSWEFLLLKCMKRELETHTSGYLFSLQSMLSQLLIQLVRQNPPIPHYVDGLALYSNVDEGKPMPDGRVVWVSDVEIWCDNPQESKKACLLRTMRAQRYFIGNSKGIIGKVTFDLEEDPEIDQPQVGRMEAIGDSTYIVLLWADEGIKPLEIDFYMNRWLYLRLHAKSNMAGSLGLALYSTTERHWFGKPIRIEEPNVWKEYVVPILWVHSQQTASPHIAKAIEYIKENYSQELHLSDISEALFVHPNYLSTIFNRELGVSISTYISNYRLMMAQKLLLESDWSIERIALEVGFYDIQHFSKAFKKKVGVSPRAFRTANRNLGVAAVESETKNP